MTDDLIERLRALSRHEHSDYSIGDEAADALEAAQRAVVIATGERNRDREACRQIAAEALRDHDQEEGSGAFWGSSPKSGGPDWTGFDG